MNSTTRYFAEINRERNAAIVAMRAQGLSFRQIGDRVNLSHETVRNIAAVRKPWIPRAQPFTEAEIEARHAKLTHGAETWRCVQCGGNEFGYSTRGKICRPCWRVRYIESGAGNARSAVAKAIRRGELPRPITLRCADCDASATEYDHRDYSKPLDVQAVCRPCNAKRGPGKWIKHHPVKTPRHRGTAPRATEPSAEAAR